MQNKELNTCKQDIYYFLHIRLPTTPRLKMTEDFLRGLFLSAGDGPAWTIHRERPEQSRNGESPEGLPRNENPAAVCLQEREPDG